MAHFVSTFPDVPSYSSKRAQEEMMYKATIRIPHGQLASDMQVQAWTSQCDDTNPHGDWHFVDLALCDSNGDMHTYQSSKTITQQKDFSFTFRMRMPHYHDWHWMHGYEQNAKVNVFPPSAGDE